MTIARALPSAPHGLFYAVDNDMRVSALAWEDIAQAIDLELCAAPPPPGIGP